LNYAYDRKRVSPFAMNSGGRYMGGFAFSFENLPNLYENLKIKNKNKK